MLLTASRIGRHTEDNQAQVWPRPWEGFGLPEPEMENGVAALENHLAVLQGGQRGVAVRFSGPTPRHMLRDEQTCPHGGCGHPSAATGHARRLPDSF